MILRNRMPAGRFRLGRDRPDLKSNPVRILMSYPLDKVTGRAVRLDVRRVACELTALSNAAALRDERLCSRAERHVLAQVRALSPVLTEDRRLDVDIARVAEWIGRRPGRG